MKVQMEVDPIFLRQIAHLIICKTPAELKKMTDEELVLRCLEVATNGTSDIRIVEEEKGR